MKDYIKKYKSRIDKNIKNLSNQTIILNGATGGIGSSVSEFLSYLHNDLVLLVRNLKEGDKLKKRLEEKYHNKIEIVYFDYLDKNSLIKSINSIKNYAKPTYFLNISGIYHQPYSLMNGIEKTYLVNYLMPSFYIKELLNLFPDIKVIAISSITSSFKVKTSNEIYSSSNNFINYLNSTGRNQIDLPLFYDIEDKRQLGLSKNEVTQMCTTFGETVKAAGFKVGIYSYLNFITNKIDMVSLPNENR